MRKEEKIETRQQYDIAVREREKLRRELLETSLALRCARAMRKALRRLVSYQPNRIEGS